MNRIGRDLFLFSGQDSLHVVPDGHFDDGFVTAHDYFFRFDPLRSDYYFSEISGISQHVEEFASCVFHALVYQHFKDFVDLVQARRESGKRFADIQRVFSGHQDGTPSVVSLSFVAKWRLAHPIAFALSLAHARQRLKGPPAIFRIRVRYVQGQKHFLLWNRKIDRLFHGLNRNSDFFHRIYDGERIQCIAAQTIPSYDKEVIDNSSVLARQSDGQLKLRPVEGFGGIVLLENGGDVDASVRTICHEAFFLG